MRKYRIKSKVRFTLFTVLAIIILITGFTTALGYNTVSSSSRDQYVQLKVKSGDTIWNIAEEYATPGTDVRKVVNYIYDLNEISADQLQAGQNIIVPIYD
ncbi:MAG: LysM peptidoglycan-binding domain-containing protein [Clostridia bacterium]|nr:LysM peptidoglycan-binding domain-containing protein [Clostridia bacterium]